MLCFEEYFKKYSYLKHEYHTSIWLTLRIIKCPFRKESNCNLGCVIAISGIKNQNWVFGKSANCVWSSGKCIPKCIWHQLKTAFKSVAVLNILTVFDSSDDSRIVMKGKEVSLMANHQCVMSSKCLGTGFCFPGTFLSCSGMVAFHLSSWKNPAGCLDKILN